MSFYEQLEKLCQKNGVKPSNVIEILGMSKGTMSNWKKGGTPSGEAVVRFAKHFHVSTDYLLLGDDYYSKQQSKNSEIEKELLEIYNKYKKNGISEYICQSLMNIFSNVSIKQKLTISEEKILDTFQKLNDDNQDIAIGELKKLLKEQNNNKSVAADEQPILKRTGTTNLGK